MTIAQAKLVRVLRKDLKRSYSEITEIFSKLWNDPQPSETIDSQYVIYHSDRESNDKSGKKLCREAEEILDIRYYSLEE
jgi:hypothetical protein